MCLLAFYTNCTRTRNFILVPSLSRVKTIGNLFLFILAGRNNWNSDYSIYSRVETIAILLGMLITINSRVEKIAILLGMLLLYTRE